MRRLSLGILSLALLAFALPASAQSFQDEVVTDMEGVKAKYVALFDAMPDEHMTWRPADGVRSVSEVFMHIALANLGLPSRLMGSAMPDGMPEGLSEQTMDRATIRAALVMGFDHVIDEVSGMSAADLETATNVFGRDTNYMGAVMLLQTHSHEHLGQAIAYARMNGIVPPWSM